MTPGNATGVVAGTLPDRHASTAGSVPQAETTLRLTCASTFMHPFYVARLLNSLDHITNGRIAFNVISSQRHSD